MIQIHKEMDWSEFSMFVVKLLMEKYTGKVKVFRDEDETYHVIYQEKE